MGKVGDHRPFHLDVDLHGRAAQLIVCVVIALSLFWGLKIVVLETTKSPVLLSFVIAYVDIGRSDTANSPIKGKEYD